MKVAETRPVLEIPQSSIERAIEAIALIGVALIVALPIHFWQSLPDQVPKHFGLVGQADAWGAKVWVLTLPMLSVLLYVGLSLLSKYPHRFNYPWRITPENAQRQYRCARQLLLGLKTVGVWIFLWIVWRTIQTALGNTTGLGEGFLAIALMSICATLEFYFLKSYRER